MYKILRADRDTYITNRVIDGTAMTGSNVGAAGTLDLFKLYGMTYSGSTPNTELSRILIHFNLDPLRALVTQGKVNTTHSSFSCTMKLFDVYGGQPTPSNYILHVNPLKTNYTDDLDPAPIPDTTPPSKLFDEGIGRDVVFYGDQAYANFMDSRYIPGDAFDCNMPWFLSGANMGGYAAQPNIDYITASAGTVLTFSQSFPLGDEDLSVDVTNAVKLILATTIPDHGFRVSFAQALEQDTLSYFVKRFSSRQAFDASKHPQLIVKYDDSVMSDQTNIRCNTTGTVLLYNTSNNRLVDLVSGSALTGSNCIFLTMKTPISGGYLTYNFSGSYRSVGVYSASVYIDSSTPQIRTKLAESSSIIFDQIWTSLDGTLPFYTGSNINVSSPSRSNDPFVFARYVASIVGVQPEHRSTELVRMRVNITDIQNQFISLVKLPIETPGLVIHDVHYSIRDVMKDTVIVPFDKTGNSTRLSSDSRGMYTDIDMSNLTSGRSYSIDLLVTGDVDQIIKDACPMFRVSETV